MVYSTNGAYWQDYTINTDITIPEGQTAYFKAKTTNTRIGSYWDHSNSFYVKNGYASVQGTLSSLLGQDPANLADYCFYNLFAHSQGLVDASGLKFCKARPFGSACYCAAFWDCQNLTALPEDQPPGG